MNFSEQLDQFVERGAEKVPSALLDFKECTCENPDWGQCPYHDRDYDVVFGYNNCANSLKPVVLKLYEACKDYEHIGVPSNGCSLSRHSSAAEALAEVEQMIGGGNNSIGKTICKHGTPTERKCELC